MRSVMQKSSERGIRNRGIRSFIVFIPVVTLSRARGLDHPSSGKLKQRIPPLSRWGREERVNFRDLISRIRRDRLDERERGTRAEDG